MMPGMELRKILEKLKTVGNPKVILITVVRFSDFEIKELKDNFNIVDYIKKPFLIDEIIRVIKQNGK